MSSFFFDVRLLLTAVPTLLLGACTVSSKEVPTEDMHPQFEVRSDASGQSAVRAELYVDAFTDVRLDGKDRIVVTGGPATATLGEKATIASGNAAGTPFRFDFQRRKRTDAPDSTGTLPAPMTLTSPAAGTSYSAQNGVILVRWSDAGSTDAMSAELAFDCRMFTGEKPMVEIYEPSLEGDTGVGVVNLRDYADDLDSRCSVYDVAFTLRRSRRGVIDEAYADDDCDGSPRFGCAGNFFVLRQVRTVPITVTNNR